MEQHVAAWQLDIFGDPSPVLIQPPKPDPLPDPPLWSTAVRDRMVDAPISLARDSRRGDSMPESLMDCAALLSERLRNVKIDIGDYNATLGWIMGYWEGAVSYEYVCTHGRIRVSPDFFRDVIYENALLTRDLRELQDLVFGRLL